MPAVPDLKLPPMKRIPGNDGGTPITVRVICTDMKSIKKGNNAIYTNRKCLTCGGFMQRTHSGDAHPWCEDKR